MSRTLRFRAAIAALLVALAACGGADPEPEEAASAGSAAAWRYTREYVFIGREGGEPLVVPFAFHAVAREEEVEREARAWLAKGATWDQFFEERWRSAGARDVWRVVPHASLRIAAGGAAGLEALWYREGDRRLRLDVGAPLSGWYGNERTRFRVVSGRLAVGAEAAEGVVLEELRARRPGTEETRDQIFVTAGDSLRLLVGSDGFAWVHGAGGERTSGDAAVEWLGASPLEPARRDVPVGWRFEVPGSAIRGELRALGRDAEVGAERGGRRSVEARYTVEGWLERAGERSRVTGVVRHAQH